MTETLMRRRASRVHIKKFLANALTGGDFDIEALIMLRDDLEQLGHYILERFGPEAFQQIIDHLGMDNLSEKDQLKLKELTTPGK